MTAERHRLKQSLGRVEVFALSFGTMIGWGWIMLASKWIEAAGVLGAMIAFCIAALMCIFVGLTYAELTSAFPLAGGEVAFSYRGLGFMGSWITGWTICFAYIIVAAWEGIALSTALHYLIPIKPIGYLWNIAGFDIHLSWACVGVIGSLVLTALNIIGVRPVAVFQILIGMLMVIVGIIYVLGGISFGEVGNMTPLFTDIKGLGTVLLMAPSMYIGFDMVAKSAEEMNMPLKSIARVLVFSIAMAGVWYILMILATSLASPPDFRLASRIPAADSATHAFGSKVFGNLTIVGGICGIFTSWNGFIVGASRILFAMGRAKMLPNIFGRVHAKYKTPVASILLVGIICSMAPFLGENALVWLVDVAAFGTVLAYLMVSISFIMIRRNEPQLLRFYKIRHSRVVGSAAVISALFFLFWYTPFSPSALKWPYEWVIVLSWFALGLTLFALLKARGTGKDIRDHEREVLIFGEEYAREP